MPELPMFPLGSVLFPTVYLPLHVFEPRYRTMVRHCLDGEPEFGVVLIERGSEVGGDDVRTKVGTVARIVESREMEDGRWLLATVGTRRITVNEWLPDAPFPRADVEDAEDEADDSDASEAYAAVVGSVRRALGLRAELGEPAAPATTDLTDDWRLGSYQASAIAPLGPADQYRLLAALSAAARIRQLAALLAEEIVDLEHRLAGH